MVKSYWYTPSISHLGPAGSGAQRPGWKVLVGAPLLCLPALLRGGSPTTLWAAVAAAHGPSARTSAHLGVSDLLRKGPPALVNLTISTYTTVPKLLAILQTFGPTAFCTPTHLVFLAFFDFSSIHSSLRLASWYSAQVLPLPSKDLLHPTLGLLIHGRPARAFGLLTQALSQLFPSPPLHPSSQASTSPRFYRKTHLSCL